MQLCTCRAPTLAPTHLPLPGPGILLSSHPLRPCEHLHKNIYVSRATARRFPRLPRRFSRALSILSVPAIPSNKMTEEKLATVDSHETDVEKGQDEDVGVAEAKENVRPSHKFDLDTGEELIRFRRHWWQIW